MYLNRKNEFSNYNQDHYLKDFGYFKTIKSFKSLWVVVDFTNEGRNHRQDSTTVLENIWLT